jgi:DegV family protein with EDD domain
VIELGKILIMTDSGADLAAGVAEKYSIRVIPFKYSFDGETYFEDGVDKSTEEFYDVERTSKEIPKTVQISPVQFEEIYNEIYSEGYEGVIYVSLSGSGSGTYQNACMMARSFEDEHKDFRIEVIDSRAYTIIYGAAAVEGAKALESGKSFDEAADRIREILDNSEVRFIVGDLAHLKKGGRINAATLVVANMLDIKPILTLKDGLVVQDGKIRGSKNLYKKFVSDAAEKMGGFDTGSVFLVHTCMPEKAAELKEEVLRQFPNVDIVENLVGSTIGCHAGPDLVGLAHFKEKITL